MAKTNAQYQREHRDRRARLITVLEAENDDLRRRLDVAQAGLDAANSELERMADRVCKHPAEAVRGGTCMACGADIW